MSGNPFPRVEKHAPQDDLKLSGGMLGYFGQKRPYDAEPGLIAAANAALAVQAPLLLTGEPGCGKTDFAWVVARSLHAQGLTPSREPLRCHVRSDSRAKDFLYRYDAVRRFADVQYHRDGDRERILDVGNYIEPGELGKAILSTKRRVVLIDEIDKAPRDLPNDLLWELERCEFEIPELPMPDAGSDSSAKWRLENGSKSTHEIVPVTRRMVRPKLSNGDEAPKPLIIITSNIERSLPEAFLRRCVFYHIQPLELTRINRILKSWYGSDFGNLAKKSFLERLGIDKLGRIFYGLRQRSDLSKLPATAELLVWALALNASFLPEENEKNLATLERLYQQIVEKESNSGAEPDWKLLPAMGCLVKTREDLERLCPKERLA